MAGWLRPRSREEDKKLGWPVGPGPHTKVTSGEEQPDPSELSAVVDGAFHELGTAPTGHVREALRCLKRPTTHNPHPTTQPPHNRT